MNKFFFHKKWVDVVSLFIVSFSLQASLETESLSSDEVPSTTIATVATPTAAEIEGIDTVNIEEGGNWLLKRKALEETVNIMELINKIFTKILEVSMDFKIKHNQLNSEYDVFIATIGFDLGDSEKLFSVLLEDMERERKKVGDLSEPERDLLNELTEKKKEIENIQTNLKNLQDFDAKIVNVMTTVDNQVETANKLQNQAWRNFQEIKKVLSDERAEELYFNTEGIYKSMQEIYNYLKGNLAQYLSEQIKIMTDNMTMIKTSLQTLKEKGLDLKKEAEKFEQADYEAEKKKLQECELKQEEVKEKAEKQSWFGWLKNIIWYPFAKIGQFFSYLWNGLTSLFKSSPAKTTPIPTESVATETPLATEPKLIVPQENA